MTLTALPVGMNSNPGAGMDVCKSIVPLRYGGTINSHLAASPLVVLVEEKISYTRAFGDGPRNFEPRSSDVDDTELAPPLNYHITPTGGHLSS
ncbi:hypothetical protein TNCV_629281 [Trichonephila clavipes]|nr:hypothetical protein TNCV_629281 [Trichonephila clavipes]